MSHDQTSLNSLSLIEHSVYYTCLIRSIDTTLKNNYLLSQPKKEKCLTSAQFEDLETVYKALNPDCDSITTCRFYYEHKQVILAGEEYISERSRSTHSSFITAYWCEDYLTGKINTSLLRIGSIIVHKVQLSENGTTQQMLCNCGMVERTSSQVFLAFFCNHHYDSFGRAITSKFYTDCKNRWSMCNLKKR